MLLDKNRNHPGRVSLASLVVLAALMLVGVGLPGEARSLTDAGSANGADLVSGRGSVDESEIAAFLDPFLARQLRDYRIPGAAVAVVSGGDVLFARGYGLANVETGAPVVADATLFKIASISKIFTATAVMQLAEVGELALDEDVNGYLGEVAIPDTYPGRPVTLRHLLTHTAGFEDRFTGSGARDAAGLGLSEYLSAALPARVWPPGEVMAYSNYGMALAGHIVEEVSGRPFDRYVEANILAPLGMGRTTFAQPPPPALGERLAIGYNIEDGKPVAGPFVGYPRDTPASAAIATATDMARFMIAHLQDGRYGEARILREPAARAMHARQFTHHPRLAGMAFGFNEQILNGERVIEHGGNQLQYHALLALLPERGVGLFVAYNSVGEGGDFAGYALLDAFLDRYYPAPAPSAVPEPAPAGAHRNAERVAGSYRATRANRSGFEKVLTLLNGARVTANADGSITTSGVPSRADLAGGERRWVEVEPLLFRAEGGDEHLAFREDGEGGIAYLFGEANPPNVTYEKVAMREAPGLHLRLLAGSLAILLLTTLAWPISATISRLSGRRHEHRRAAPASGSGSPRGFPQRARIAAWSVCVLDLLFVVGMALVFSNIGATAYGASPLLLAVLTLPLLSAALTVGVIACAAMAWKRRDWGPLGRLHYSLVALAALTFVALLGYYNLHVCGI
jgi:CubicO group peptidase (beta-lactamase class C family)